MGHTFVVSCDMNYLYGLAATMNAAKFYGTKSDFVIAYHDNIPKEVRDSFVSFPFKISWVPMTEVLKDVKPSAKNSPNPFWIAPWVLGSQIIDDYDSICILQADEIVLTNVNSLFYIVDNLDMVIASEYTITNIEFEDLPFGTTRSISHRGQFALYDQLVFLNKKYKQILIDTYQAQCIDPWKDEANHPMCGLNQACATHLTSEKVLGLDAHVWCWDRDEWDYKLLWDSSMNKLYNERKIRINGVHARPWQRELVQHAVNVHREAPNNKTRYDIGVHNFNLLKDIVVWLNSLSPETKALEYYAARYE